MDEKSADYSQWSHTDLIARVTELEKKLAKKNNGFFNSYAPPNARERSPPAEKPKPTKKQRAFDASKYTTRHIALKFAYLGQRYNGYEHHANNLTPLPAVEEELWRALMKCRLIFPTQQEGAPQTKHGRGPWEGTVNWDGTDYSKCGRTDKGVSAFGQVVGIRVRSNRPVKPKALTEAEKIEEVVEAMMGKVGEGQTDPGGIQVSSLPSEQPEKPFHDVRDEMPYLHLLNRVLPPDIRVLAWCPNPPPDFSARFHCKERRYRYFFTNPAFLPVPGSQSTADGWLDLAAMRKAASYLEGLHDFRNFCKIDPSKQITNFERRIFHTSIDEVSTLDTPSFAPLYAQEVAPMKVYSFEVHGSAFLWHQVRCLVAVLFLVGQGLENPDVVEQLLDVKKCSSRPNYEMATDAPLVLWDCIFPKHPSQPSQASEKNVDALNWIYVGDDTGGIDGRKSNYDGKWGGVGVMDDIWQIWRNRKMEEVLAALLMQRTAVQGSETPEQVRARAALAAQKNKTTRWFGGGDSWKPVGEYVPVMKKQRMESIEVVNARYAAKKGLAPRESTAAAKDDANE
ncbi:pseudouridine synthase [Aulographum hederae CBS 113979]|uniref:Pseudouridine synthase n=1 Tax=Aulographum hederae CBS 113979 TaxID=1176131 RepID=A0A6G1GQW6_9PEZI|nr:pseudouridine synthase [Aulographum hederae CBS 113979]